MALQRFNGAEIGNIPNASVEELQKLADATTDTSTDGMTPLEKIKYQAEKMADREEMDPEFLRALGRDTLTPRATPENIQSVVHGQRMTMPRIEQSPQPTSTPVQRTPSAPQTTTDRTIVPRPPKTGGSFVSSAKDELTVPIYKVTEFIRLVMGDNFGYVSKKTASEMIDIIPKDCALLAIETSDEYAKKFLQYHDEEVRKAAMKRVFHVESDDELGTYEKIISMPGFEINPWAE